MNLVSLPRFGAARLMLACAALLLAACGSLASPVTQVPTAVPPPAAPTPEAPAPTGAPTAAAQAVEDVRTLGDPNAPVTVIEYSDFQ